ncbi:MAG: flagellar motor switch protein FliM [Deltaproteobacteria bacterium]|nr:flagellar motor switch protein FliM [Deltaproteobacteria bacterium]
MEKILSQEEIDALQTAVSEGRNSPADAGVRERRTVTSYDLFNHATPEGQAPDLSVIYDDFIRRYQVSMANRLRKNVVIKKLEARSYKYEDFLQTLPSPVCIGIYKVEPLKGSCLFTMDSKQVFAIVDSVLGGGGASRIPDTSRMFTSIELKIVERIGKDLLQDMEKAWAALYPVKTGLVRLETNPKLAIIAASDNRVAAMELEVQIEGNVSTMLFAVPFATVEPLRDKLKNGTQFDAGAADPNWAQRLSTELGGTSLSFAVTMGNASINLRELLNLAPGDTIMLDKDIRSELLVKIEGVEKFYGLPGMHRGNRAVQITRFISREAEL